MVESKLQVFSWRGRESRGVQADGYIGGFYLHLLALDSEWVEGGEAWVKIKTGDWTPWNRTEPWTGRWTLDSAAASGGAQWWFSVDGPKAHWPGVKTLRAYNPLDRKDSSRRNPL